jgi:hypothetical protein
VFLAGANRCRGGDPLPAERRIEEALSSPTELEFIETPLQDVVDYLKDYHKIEIQLDEKALEDLGVGKDIPVTKNLHGLSLRSALNLLLPKLGLTYVVQNEVLLITTAEDAANRLSTKVYPVADLTGSAGEPAERQAKLEALLHTITTTVAPDTWRSGGVVPDSMSSAASRGYSRRGDRSPRDPAEGSRAAGGVSGGDGRGTVVGGSFGSHGAPELLIVRQTYEVHRQIAELLRELRKADLAGKPR